MRMKVFLMLIMTFTTLYAGVFLKFETTNLSLNTFDIEASLISSNFDAFANLSISNNEKYYDPYHSRFYFGYNFNGFGGLYLKFKNISFKAGKILQRDEVDSPYSLFLNSQRNPYVSMSLIYENNLFFFKTVWIELTKSVDVKNSVYSYTFPDRGMNYRVIGIEHGDFKFGYQESVIYTDRTFDFEYFFNPLPNFFTQYINFVGRPFRQGTNDSSILGFFMSYRSKILYVYLQILVDDLNMNRFYGGFQNPDKIGWSVGGKFSTPIGRFFVYHAGTTKYTFEPSTSDIDDQYYHYPDVIAPVGNSTRVISIEENCVGYKYGENTVSFLAGLDKEIIGFKTNLQFELALSGSKSPVVPWQGYGKIPQGTHLLDEYPVEKIFRISGSIKKQWNNLSVSSKIEYEHIENPLTLVKNIYKPSEGLKNFIRLSFGLSYSF